MTSKGRASSSDAQTAATTPVSGASSWFETAPSGLTHIEELRRYAEELPEYIGPMFGRDVVRLCDSFCLLVSRVESGLRG